MTIMWITILGMLISSVVSVILSDKIIFSIHRIFVRLGVSRNSDITGVWKATFVIGTGKNKSEYTEIIFLKNILGTIYGRIKEDSRNYENLQSVMAKKPLRVKGFLSDNRYFTGFWYHPIETYRFHGSYQLIIDGSFNHMRGQWIGYSESNLKITSGEWNWEKLL